MPATRPHGGWLPDGWGLCGGHARSSSMVVLEVDFDSVLAVEGERQPQIAGDIDRPAVALIAPQRVEAPPRDAHVLRPDGGIQPVEHAFDSRPPGSGNASGRTCSEKRLQTFVPKGTNHA